MARHFANHINFSELHRGMPASPFATAFDSGGFDVPVRVMLIAIRHDPQPPVFYGHQLLQRLQALLAAPGDQAESIQQEPPAGFARQIPAELFDKTRATHSPRVLPPLPPAPSEHPTPKPRLVHGDLLTDSKGQLYERFGRQVRPLQHVVSGPRGEILELVAASKPNSVANPKTGDRPVESNATAEAQPPIAAGQMATARSAAPHRPMRPAPRRTPIERAPQQVNRQPDQHPNRQAVQQQPPPRVEEQPQTAQQTNETAPAAAPAKKTAIPEDRIKPWELRLSRDEALYDMQLEAAANDTLIGSIRNLKRRIGNRQAFQKWQALLCGKSLAEQLWEVRPPAGQFSHPQVREWAQRALAQAGYDPGVMLTEWEIFWRRKGF